MIVWDELIIGIIEMIEVNLVMINIFVLEEFVFDGKCFIECDNIVDICIDIVWLKFIIV